MKRITYALLATLLSLTAMAQSENDSFHKRIKIHGYGQVYAEASHNGNAFSKTTFGINKIEILGIGQITKNWTAGVTVQLNSPIMLKDLYMQYSFMPELRIKVGQFKTPFLHENQYPPFLNPLVLGGSIPTIYFAGVAMNPLYYGTAGRDMGLEINGDLFHKLLSYRLAVMNGQGMNALDLNKGKLIGGSLYIRPVKGLALHTSYLGGRQVAMKGNSEIKSGATYTSHRASAGVIANYQPISVMAEFMYGRENTTNAMGAYLTTAIHLPKRTDLVLATDYLQPNINNSDRLYTASAGVDKWFKGNCRIQVQYRYAHPTTSNLPMLKGHTLRTQLQFQF